MLVDLQALLVTIDSKGVLSAGQASCTTDVVSFHACSRKRYSRCYTASTVEFSSCDSAEHHAALPLQLHCKACHVWACRLALYSNMSLGWVTAAIATGS
jgi:hypothetical protein